MQARRRVGLRSFPGRLLAFASLARLHGWRAHRRRGSVPQQPALMYVRGNPGDFDA
jgi:hypothetical protein